MNGRKNILMAAVCIAVGMALAGPAAQAAELFLKAFPAAYEICVDGERLDVPAYSIHDNTYVKLRDIGEAVGFNVYWDGSTAQVESDKPYTGTAPVAADELLEVRQEIFELVNQVRRERGLQELTVEQALMDAAQLCADQKYTSHHNQFECETALACGYPYGFSANLTAFTGAATEEVAARAVSNWVNSSGHFRTLIDPACEHVGVGVCRDGNWTYCYLLVGDPGSHNPYE